MRAGARADVSAGAPPNSLSVLPRIIIVGLGPAGSDLLLPAARSAIERVPARYTRTTRHPCVEELQYEGLQFSTFDGIYELEEYIASVYEKIVGILIDVARARGEVLYAVPGSPAVAETTVELLRSADVALELEVIPGLSFADLAWARLGVDPMHAGARVVDGHGFASRSRHEMAIPLMSGAPLLIAQCDSRSVLSDVKLELLEHRDPAMAVTVLQRLGLSDERIVRMPLAELDHADVVADHLTSVFVPGAGRPHEVGESWVRFVALIERLRAPGGCPWDAEQTHHSLTRHLLEETYEVLEVIEQLPASAPGGDEPVDAALYALLEEELGDLLCQAVFHTTLAKETGAFTITEVVNGIHDKLVRRHPHVFGEIEVSGSEQVLRNWEQIKKEEKGVTSLMDQVPGNLPSLLYAHKLYRKAASGGLEWGPVSEVASRVVREAEQLRAASGLDIEARVGSLLGAVVNLAYLQHLDAEAALRGWAARFRDQFQTMERLAVDRGTSLESLDPVAVSALWHEAEGPTGVVH